MLFTIFELITDHLWDIGEKSAKLIGNNLQVDNYQVDLKKFKENLGLKNFDSSWWLKG